MSEPHKLLSNADLARLFASGEGWDIDPVLWSAFPKDEKVRTPRSWKLRVAETSSVITVERWGLFDAEVGSPFLLLGESYDQAVWLRKAIASLSVVDVSVKSTLIKPGFISGRISAWLVGIDGTTYMWEEGKATGTSLHALAKTLVFHASAMATTRDALDEPWVHDEGDP